MDTTTIDTVRDAIKTAFKALRRKGYFCRSNFTCCQSCGFAAVPEGRGDKVVFYHRQDVDDIEHEGGCFLAWAGNGHEIVAAMKATGLDVEWDGSEQKRIWVEAPKQTAE